MNNYKNTAIGIAMLIFIAGFVLVAVKKNTRENEMAPVAVDAIDSSDIIFGNPDARVVLIEYGDYQCPACALYNPLVKQITEEYRNSIAFVYRHFPLQQHIYALPAAYAAEAAGVQGKFWEMHDLLYRRQDEWVKAKNAKGMFAEYASLFGLDANKFREDASSDTVKEKVRGNYQGGIKAGINATPTFILNGAKIQPRTYDEFKSFIDNAIANT